MPDSDQSEAVIILDPEILLQLLEQLFKPFLVQIDTNRKTKCRRLHCIDFYLALREHAENIT